MFGILDKTLSFFLIVKIDRLNSPVKSYVGRRRHRKFKQVADQSHAACERWHLGQQVDVLYFDRHGRAVLQSVRIADPEGDIGLQMCPRMCPGDLREFRLHFR